MSRLDEAFCACLLVALDMFLANSAREELVLPLTPASTLADPKPQLALASTSTWYSKLSFCVCLFDCSAETEDSKSSALSLLNESRMLEALFSSAAVLRNVLMLIFVFSPGSSEKVCIVRPAP